jgi:glycosyltransferase involved in cell wall biosynthesis
MNPQITIIIRTSNRPELFTRALQSVRQQTFPVEILVAYDNPGALEYVPGDVRSYPVSADKTAPFFYDLYCNTLLQIIGDGWILFLDDDDWLSTPRVIEQMVQHLDDPDRPIICQFLRHNMPKPNAKEMAVGCIKEGKIGLPCLFLHAKHKNLARLDGQKSGDYRFILAISEALKCKFIEQVVVETDRRSFGKMEAEKD